MPNDNPRAVRTAAQADALRRTVAKQRKARHARIREAYRQAAIVGAVPSPARITELASNIADSWRLPDRTSLARYEQAPALSADQEADRVTRQCAPAPGQDWGGYDAIAEYN